MVSVSPTRVTPVPRWLQPRRRDRLFPVRTLDLPVTGVSTGTRLRCDPHVSVPRRIRLPSGTGRESPARDFRPPTSRQAKQIKPPRCQSYEWSFRQVIDSAQRGVAWMRRQHVSPPPSEVHPRHRGTLVRPGGERAGRLPLLFHHHRPSPDHRRALRLDPGEAPRLIRPRRRPALCRTEPRLPRSGPGRSEECRPGRGTLPDCSGGTVFPHRRHRSRFGDAGQSRSTGPDRATR